MHEKLAPNPFLILVNQPKQNNHCIQEVVLKIRYFERELSKWLKNVNFIFILNLVSFNGQDYEKQKGSGTTDQSLFRLPNKFRKIPLLVMYYLTKFDDVI